MTDVAYSRQEFENFELPTNDVPIVFDGYFISDLDNNDGDRLRWAVLSLYRWYQKDTGNLGYILYTTGHSVVYHELGGRCGYGEPHSVSEFPALHAAGRIENPADLEPCETCRPIDPDDWSLVPPDQEFEVEITWYKWSACRDVEELLLAGRREARCRNCLCRPHRDQCRVCNCANYVEGPRPLSGPMQRLLGKAKYRDADISYAMRAKKIEL